MKVSFVLNGRSVSCEAEADEVLVDTLRNTFCLTGTKKACGTGDCGACTVLLDGVAIRSCIYLTAMAEGHEITTIEGVGTLSSPIRCSRRSWMQARCSAATAHPAWCSRRSRC